VPISKSKPFSGGGPIRDDQTLKTPVALENVVDQKFIFGAMLAAEFVVGAHHGQYAALLHGRFEGGEINLAQGAIVHLDVDREAVGLLIVGGEMFDA
jgi:hypothetical protein